jgi:hypothetical protein
MPLNRRRSCGRDKTSANGSNNNRERVRCDSIVLFDELIDLSVRYMSLKRGSSDELCYVFSPLDINSSLLTELEGNVRSPCQIFVHFVDRNTATCLSDPGELNTVNT